MENMENIDKPKNKGGRPKGSTAAAMRERGTSRAAVIEARVSGEIAPPAAPKRGTRLRPEHQEEVRAKIQASYLVNRLQQHVRGEVTLEPTQIKAAEILLSKSLSSLASTEVNMISNNDKMTEAEIMDKIRQLVQADPRLLSMVVPGEAREVVDPPAPADIDPDAPADIDPDVPADIDPDAPCPMCGTSGLPGGCPLCGDDGERAPDNTD